jgi:hypothetical protein
VARANTAVGISLETFLVLVLLRLLLLLLLLHLALSAISTDMSVLAFKHPLLPACVLALQLGCTYQSTKLAFQTAWNDHVCLAAMLYLGARKQYGPRAYEC